MTRTLFIEILNQLIDKEIIEKLQYIKEFKIFEHPVTDDMIKRYNRDIGVLTELKTYLEENLK